MTLLMKIFWNKLSMSAASSLAKGGRYNKIQLFLTNLAENITLNFASLFSALRAMHARYAQCDERRC